MPSANASKGSRTSRWLVALGLHRRELRAWALYDWANSAFATTIMASLFPIFYREVAAGTLASRLRTPYWAYTAGLALLVVAIISPILGAAADYLGAKKKFLAAFAFIGIVATAMLCFVGRGDWLYASLVFIVANVGFAAANVFYESLLPHVARPGETDRVSTAGYAVGYVGGGVLLAINVAWVLWPASFGMTNPLLFRVQGSFENALDRGKVPPQLRLEFQNRQSPLSDDAAVLVDRIESNWAITDRNSNETYLIRQIGGTFEVVDPLRFRVKEPQSPFRQTLDNGVVPPQLRQAFRERQIALAEDGALVVKKMESTWAITDGKRNESFILRKNGATLDVSAERNWAVRAAFLSVAVWWFVFSLPILRRVSEPPRRIEHGERVRMNALLIGFARLRETFSELRQYRHVLVFLLAFWLYSDGIGTIIKMAAVYGDEIGIPTGHIVGALLLVQFVGIPFTFAFGTLAGIMGAKRGLYLALAVYAAISILAYRMTSRWQFWALALAIATVQGGAQALSRSIYSSMIPRGKSSEFFAFYSVSAKFAGILGPILFGLVSQVVENSRPAILFLIVFFLAGIVLLSRVDVEQGRRVAEKEDAELVVADNAASAANSETT